MESYSQGASSEGWSQQPDQDDGWSQQPDQDQHTKNFQIPQQSSSQYDFTFIPQEDVQKQMNVRIQEIKETLFISEDECILSLRYYSWNIEKLKDKWFDDEFRLREEIGITYSKQPYTDIIDDCPICYASFQEEKALGLQCGHQFCQACWQEYLKAMINEGAQKSLRAPCQQTGCNMIVPHSFFVNLLSDEPILQTYLRWSVQSFTDDNKNVRWCPFIKVCNYAVERNLLSENIVDCKCGNQFCFRCGDEKHTPIDCDMLKNWNLKKLPSGDSEHDSQKWIEVNTKNCPQCKKPIEKNNGCSHMCCRQCKHQFCWICLQEWRNHTVERHFCKKEYIIEHETKQNSLEEIKKYMHCLQMYEDCEGLIKRARDFKIGLHQGIKQLNELKHYPLDELEFLNQGLEIIIKCRQVLKFSYCYIYFQKEVSLIEIQITLLKESCDRLGQKIVQPLEPFLDLSDPNMQPFSLFKSELKMLTEITDKSCEQFVEAIEQQKIVGNEIENR